MFVRAVIFATLAYVARSNVDTMRYMDDLLTGYQRQAVRDGLDRVAIRPFQFKLSGNGITTRDLKVNVTDGSIQGLHYILRRGDCPYDFVGGQRKLGCNVTVSAVRISLDAEVKGDSILAAWHNISTSTVVDSNFQALVEVQGISRLFAKFVQVTTRPVTMTTSVSQGKLDLNKERFKDFVEQLNDALAKQIFSALTGPICQTLSSLARISRLP